MSVQVMGEDADIRIGDAERTDARARLDEQLSAGRLSNAEHEERHALAGAARTRGDLRALFEDLPLPYPDLSSPAVPASRPAAWRPVAKTLWWIGVAYTLAGFPAAIVLTITSGMWWLFIVVFVAAVTAFWTIGETDQSQTER
jgi:Domain of unknown function (DUF1707)